MPVLGNMEGFASWKLMPQYPTMMHYVELLLDSPEFFVMFWNSVKAYSSDSGRSASGGNSGGMGICKIPVSG